MICSLLLRRKNRERAGIFVSDFFPLSSGKEIVVSDFKKNISEMNLDLDTTYVHVFFE